MRIHILCQGRASAFTSSMRAFHFFFSHSQTLTQVMITGLCRLFIPTFPINEDTDPETLSALILAGANMNKTVFGTYSECIALANAIAPFIAEGYPSNVQQLRTGDQMGDEYTYIKRNPDNNVTAVLDEDGDIIIGKVDFKSQRFYTTKIVFIH